mmetsp:Transcript_14437/g.44595  ORF Transcript_14437/g.44595 Transcript_14437/m.44595 type:complete len:391 (+) Transcript_14437:159-1331(+)
MPTYGNQQQSCHWQPWQSGSCVQLTAWRHGVLAQHLGRRAPARASLRIAGEVTHGRPQALAGQPRELEAPVARRREAGHSAPGRGQGWGPAHRQLQRGKGGAAKREAAEGRGARGARLEVREVERRRNAEPTADVPGQGQLQQPAALHEAPEAAEALAPGAAGAVAHEEHLEALVQQVAQLVLPGQRPHIRCLWRLFRDDSNATELLAKCWLQRKRSAAAGLRKHEDHLGRCHSKLGVKVLCRNGHEVLGVSPQTVVAEGRARAAKGALLRAEPLREQRCHQREAGAAEVLQGRRVHGRPVRALGVRGQELLHVRRVAQAPGRAVAEAAAASPLAWPAGRQPAIEEVQPLWVEAAGRQQPAIHGPQRLPGRAFGHEGQELAHEGVANPTA